MLRPKTLQAEVTLPGIRPTTYNELESNFDLEIWSP